MKFLTGLLLAVFLAGVSAGGALAANYSKGDLEKLSQSLDEVFVTLCSLGDLNVNEKPLDMVKGASLNDAELLTFCIYYTYNYRPDAVKHVQNGKPFDLYENGEPVDSYCLVPFKAAIATAKQVFGRDLQIPAAKKGKIGEYFVNGNDFVIGEGDAAYMPPLKAVSVQDGADGLLNVVCEQEDEEEEGKKLKFNAVVREISDKGQKSWQILAIKPAGR